MIGRASAHAQLLEPRERPEGRGQRSAKVVRIQAPARGFRARPWCDRGKWAHKACSPVREEPRNAGSEPCSAFSEIFRLCKLVKVEKKEGNVPVNWLPRM